MPRKKKTQDIIVEPQPEINTMELGDKFEKLLEEFQKPSLFEEKPDEMQTKAKLDTMNHIIMKQNGKIDELKNQRNILSKIVYDLSTINTCLITELRNILEN